MLGSKTPTCPSTERVLLALLEADRDLGCCPDMYRAVRHHPDIRRTIIAQTAVDTPYIRKHIVPVDFDHPSNRQLNPHEFSHVPISLRAEHFRVDRTGREEVEVYEIFTGHTMSTASQSRLLKLLELNRPCLAVTRSTLREVFPRPVVPVMAHCGDEVDAGTEGPIIPSLLQTATGLIPVAARMAQRWSQDFRLLAVA